MSDQGVEENKGGFGTSFLTPWILPFCIRLVLSYYYNRCWLCCNSFSENLCHPGSNLGTALPPALKESSFMLHRMALLSARNAGKIIS